MSLYASGRLSGLIIECGHLNSKVTGIIDGVKIPYSFNKIDFGGYDILKKI